MSEFQSLSRACGPTSGSTTRSVPISHSITGPLARSIGPGFTGGERGKALTNAGGLSGPPFGVHYRERSRPIFKQFHDWLEAEAPKVLPKSPIGEAIGYALNHWAALERPLDLGFLELDNGACERALKPVAIGRKNWLFAGSDRGGQTAAVLMSLCTTCKNLGIDPQAYLRDVLERISTHPARRIEELLPDRWQALRQAGEAAKD